MSTLQTYFPLLACWFTPLSSIIAWTMTLENGPPLVPGPFSLSSWLSSGYFQPALPSLGFSPMNDSLRRVLNIRCNRYSLTASLGLWEDPLELPGELQIFSYHPPQAWTAPSSHLLLKFIVSWVSTYLYILVKRESLKSLLFLQDVCLPNVLQEQGRIRAKGQSLNEVRYTSACISAWCTHP